MKLYQGPSLPLPLTPDSVMWAFDLHGVLFYRSWLSLVSYMLKSPHRAVFARFVLNPSFWWRFYKIAQTTAVGDELYEKLVAYYPELRSFKKDFIELENMQSPDDQMVAFLSKLKEHKFKLCVLSNIGLDAYTALAKKFSFLAVFDEVYVPSCATGYCQKPSPLFYTNFKKYLLDQGYAHQHIFFIDDKPVNIRAAAECGIAGAVFKSPLSFKALVEKLLARPL